MEISGRTCYHSAIALPSMNTDPFRRILALAIAAGALSAHAVSYVDADGVERQCLVYTDVTNAAGRVSFGSAGATNWYVAAGSVTVRGSLEFLDGCAHLVLADGATLTVENDAVEAVQAGVLVVYGQRGGTGALVAEAPASDGISASALVVNGGIVDATGAVGILAGAGGVAVNGGTVDASGSTTGIWSLGDFVADAGNVNASGSTGIRSGGDFVVDGGSVNVSGGTVGVESQGGVAVNGGRVLAAGGAVIRAGGDIVLGWTRPRDRIVAGGYESAGGSVSIAPGLRMTDGTDSYQGPLTADQIAAIAGKTLRPFVDGPFSYVDADGTERTCSDYRFVESAVGGVELGASGEDAWYVVFGDVEISGGLSFAGDHARLLLADDSMLSVSNDAGNAVSASGSLAVYGQAAGTGVAVFTGTYGIQTTADLAINGGTVDANGDSMGVGIYAGQSVVVNGGAVDATGMAGILASADVVLNGGIVNVAGGMGLYAGGDVVLGWTRSTDRIYASDYFVPSGSVSVRAGQFLAVDDGTIFSGDVSARLEEIKNRTLLPYVPSTQPILTVGDVTETTALATWTPCDGVTNYTVQLASDDQFVAGGSLLSSTVVAGTSHEFSGLVPNTVYYARVKGEAEWSDAVAFTARTPLAYPDYLGLPDDPADDTPGQARVRSLYEDWADQFGPDEDGGHEAAFLLNVSPEATPVSFRVVAIRPVADGAQVDVLATAGRGIVDLSKINGALFVEAGASPGALSPKAVRAGNLSYDGETHVATIVVPASDGAFVRARIGLSAPSL